MSFPKMKFLRPVMASFLLITVGTFAQSNGVLREVYYNIGGNAVANLTSAPNFPARPDEEFIENAFEAPSNFADNYGQRMRALLVPPVTGGYVFLVSRDDKSGLFLSTKAEDRKSTRLKSHH